MKELVRDNLEDILLRAGAYCRAIRVFHSSPAGFGIRTDVKEKHVLIERRASHQMQFVCHDFVQAFFEKNSIPQFTVQYRAEARAALRERETIEFAYFRRRIHK
jgi:hypothetical protein